MTASIGIAIYPENGLDFDTLVQNADAAMLGIKNDGRNNYRFVADWEAHPRNNANVGPGAYR